MRAGSRLKFQGLRLRLVAAAAAGAASLTLGAGALGGEAASVSRASVWRSIFARPDEMPKEDALTRLGGELFADLRLSGDESRSCATCHDPGRGYSNGARRGIGRDGTQLRRNVPALYNLAWGTSFYWDGRAASLEDQARHPILNGNELGGSFAAIIERLKADPVMRAKFAQAFPVAPVISESTILTAIAAFERTLVSPVTRFDRWVLGEDAALTPEEQRGLGIFVGKGGCVACHGGWRLTGDQFHDIGLMSEDRGRGELAAGERGLPQFKTPGLRALAHTAPYMHDGSKATLMDVVDHYAGGLERRPSLAPVLRRDLVLSDEEKQALVAFLNTL